MIFDIGGYSMREHFKCPACGSMKTRIYATPAKYKAQQIRYRVCNDCAIKFCTKPVDGIESFIGYVQLMKNRV